MICMCVSLWAWWDWEVVAAHHRVHDHACCHLQADCLNSGSAQAPYARHEYGYLYFTFTTECLGLCEARSLQKDWFWPASLARLQQPRIRGQAIGDILEPERARLDVFRFNALQHQRQLVSTTALSAECSSHADKAEESAWTLTVHITLILRWNALHRLLVGRRTLSRISARHTDVQHTAWPGTVLSVRWMPAVSCLTLVTRHSPVTVIWHVQVCCAVNQDSSGTGWLQVSRCCRSSGVEHAASFFALGGHALLGSFVWLRHIVTFNCLN